MDGGSSSPGASSVSESRSGPFGGDGDPLRLVLCDGEGRRPVFLAPDTEYEILTPHLCDRSAALISGPLLRAITAESGLTDHPVLTLPAPEIPGRMLESLGDLLPESSRPAVRRKISNLCFELIQYLHAPDVRSPLPENLKRVLEKIGREYDMPLRGEALAREAGISESGLLRLFRRHLGSTPHRYLTEIRMHQAARMLEQHTLSVRRLPPGSAMRMP